MSARSGSPATHGRRVFKKCPVLRGSRGKQLDLFNAQPAPEPADSVIDLKVRMPGACARCRCRLSITAAGTPPHKAGLRCSGCGVHRGWISEEVLRFIQNLVATFGRPTRPIDFRHVKRGGAMRQK